MFETNYNIPDRQLKATLCFGLCSKQFIAVAPDKPWCILCYPYFTSHTMFNTAFPFLLHLINLHFSRLNLNVFVFTCCDVLFHLFTFVPRFYFLQILSICIFRSYEYLMNESQNVATFTSIVHSTRDKNFDFLR